MNTNPSYTVVPWERIWMDVKELDGSELSWLGDWPNNPILYNHRLKGIEVKQQK